MSQVPSDVAKRISLALLTAPPQTEAGIAWSTANSFKSIDQLYRELKWGRYEYLRHWTFTRVWEAVWPFVLAALVAFLALMLHLRRVNALVERRTRELNDEAARRMALEESNTALLQKFHRYEQMSTMGMLSNMVAHEIRQPLSALRYALRTIEMAAARDEEDSAVIEKSCAKARRQTERINDIVEHVCSYARTDRRNLPINLSALIRETVSEAAQMKLIHHAVTLVLPDNAFITGNPLELQLVVLNLLKNSLRSCSRTGPAVQDCTDLRRRSRRADRFRRNRTTRCSSARAHCLLRTVTETRRFGSWPQHRAEHHQRTRRQHSLQCTSRQRPRNTHHSSSPRRPS